MKQKIINTVYYEDYKSFKQAILDFFENIDVWKEEMISFIGNQPHFNP